MSVNPEWEASLERIIAEAREELTGQDPEHLAQESGAELHRASDGRVELRLSYFGSEYRLTWPDLAAHDEQGAVSANPEQAALLQYLVCADGTPMAGHWVSLRELPNGAFYERAFQGYTGNMLARTFGNDREGFAEACRQLGGVELSMGDAAFRFWALPRIPLAVVYWSGGEEFPASVHVLFDASASHYHHLEMLAHLGATLSNRLVTAYGP